MNDLEARLDYVFGEQLPAPGTPLPVADGIHWLRMNIVIVPHLSTSIVSAPFTLGNFENCQTLSTKRPVRWQMPPGGMRHVT